MGTYTTEKSMDVDDLIRQLGSFDFSPTLIAAALRLPVTQVRELVAVVKRTYTPTDVELADAMKRLVWACYREGMKVVEFGPSEHRIAIMKSVLGNSTKYLQKEEDQGTQEVKQAFERLLLHQRENILDAVVLDAPTARTDDPDEATDDGEVPD